MRLTNAQIEEAVKLENQINNDLDNDSLDREHMVDSFDHYEDDWQDMTDYENDNYEDFLPQEIYGYYFDDDYYGD